MILRVRSRVEDFPLSRAPTAPVVQQFGMSTVRSCSSDCPTRGQGRVADQTSPRTTGKDAVNPLPRQSASLRRRPRCGYVTPVTSRDGGRDRLWVAVARRDGERRRSSNYALRTSVVCTAIDAGGSVCVSGCLCGIFTGGAPGSLVGKPGPVAGSGRPVDGRTMMLQRARAIRRKTSSPRTSGGVSDSGPPANAAHMRITCGPACAAVDPRRGMGLRPVADWRGRAAAGIQDRRTSK